MVQDRLKYEINKITQLSALTSLSEYLGEAMLSISANHVINIHISITTLSKITHNVRNSRPASLVIHLDISPDSKGTFNCASYVIPLFVCHSVINHQCQSTGRQTHPCLVWHETPHSTQHQSPKWRFSRMGTFCKHNGYPQEPKFQSEHISKLWQSLS